MAHYVMSDIHGEADRFYSMLDIIKFGRDDTLFILGDVVDRGPDGIELLQYIMSQTNIVMILGNHEYMFHMAMGKESDETEMRRWNRNGNAPTLQAFLALSVRERRKILDYLSELPTNLQISVNGRLFYFVHGFPGESAFDDIWGRPRMGSRNPAPGHTLIIGHTPVIHLLDSDRQRNECAQQLIRSGEHMKICHTPGFIDLDCGCGHSVPFKALSCLRLEDFQEFYA